jgi:hypothetical protein
MKSAAPYFMFISVLAGSTIFFIIHSYSFFSCGISAQRGSWPPHSSGLYITQCDAPLLVGLLWVSDQPFAETSTWQYTTLTTVIHAVGGIRTQSHLANGLIPRGYWDRPLSHTHHDFRKKVIEHKTHVWISSTTVEKFLVWRRIQ